MTPNAKYPGWYAGDNRRLFELMSIFLNLAPDYIEPSMVEAITGGNRDFSEYAYASLAASACGLDVYENKEDKRFFAKSFLPMFRRLDPGKYRADPYYRNIRFPAGTQGKWTFRTQTCKPYEAFVYDDPDISGDAYEGYRVIPRIGFFEEAYDYPAVLENGREWMTLMPNETQTSGEAVRRARGRVLTFGLGLGYFTYMAALKSEVASVTVVELSPDVIALFKEHILPQFPHPEKVKLVQSDAFAFCEQGLGDYDMIET